MHDDSIILSPSLTCQECSEEWTDASERWRLYVMPDDPTETLIYCPVCASREFED
jgi:hypothetical protein